MKGGYCPGIEPSCELAISSEMNFLLIIHTLFRQPLADINYYL